MTAPGQHTGNACPKSHRMLWLILSVNILFVCIICLKPLSEGAQSFTPRLSLSRREVVSGASRADQVFSGQSDEFSNLTRQLSKRDDYACHKGVPCKTQACCGSFFGGDDGVCGFGETFCGSDCDSQCDAKPECGQYADPPGKLILPPILFPLVV